MAKAHKERVEQPVPRPKHTGHCPHARKTCKQCGRPIKYNEAINKNIVKVGKEFCHTRCVQKNIKFEPLSKLEKMWIKLHSKFVQCNFCEMILDRDNAALHILKCCKSRIEIQEVQKNLILLQKQPST